MSPLAFLKCSATAKVVSIQITVLSSLASVFGPLPSHLARLAHGCTVLSATDASSYSRGKLEYSLLLAVMPLLLVAMPLLLVVMPLLLVTMPVLLVMPLLLVVMPLLLVAMP